MTVLVTGANGFVGRGLCASLYRQNQAVVPCVRSPTGLPGEVLVGAIDGATAWTRVWEGVDVVVHLAAKVHIIAEQDADSLAGYRKTNVEGTLALARQAAQHGVRRFIFLSSVKVNGPSTARNRPFAEDDIPQPHALYEKSKYEAELALHAVAKDTDMQVVIIRPPLVYGPGVRANFQALMRAVAYGIPLPLASVDNRRSLVALDNLLDLIVTCINHPAAANQTFFVSDGLDLSTPALIRGLAHAMEKPPLLFACPPTLLQFAARIGCKADVMARLCGNLQVDITKAQTLLGWKPPVSVAEGLRRAVSHNINL